MASTLGRLGLGGQPELSPSEAYRLSLELGASYSATVTHLVNLRRIERHWANYLLDHSPKSIKEEITQTPREEARSDVWSLTEADQGKRLYPRIGDELVIELPGDADLRLYLVAGGVRGTQQKHDRARFARCERI